MLKLLIDKIPRIIKGKRKLEQVLDVKISNRGKEVYIEGTGENEYVAEKVLLALDFGFPFSSAVKIKKNDLLFEILNIKDYTKSNNLERIRGRLIGTQGKTLKTISDISNCHIELKDNQVGIIGYPEEIMSAQEAVISIIQGAKHGNVYVGLSKKKSKKTEELDLGLKE